MGKNFIKTMGTSLLAGLICLSCTTSVFAQSAGDMKSAERDALENGDVIDTAKKGSLSIYKYDMTAAEAAGAYTEGEHTATGEADDTLQQKMAPYAVEGVEFTYLRCGDIETYSYDGGKTVKVVYEIPEDLRGLLQLETADAVDMKDPKNANPCEHTGVWHYTSQQLSDALKMALDRDDVKMKSELEAYAASSEQAVAMTMTDKNGHTSAADLSVGLYLLVETKVPEQIVASCNPWFVSLPFTNQSGNWNSEEGGQKWLYDMTCYPKNQSGNPTLDKLVRQSQNNGGDALYNSTESVSEGDVLDYILISKLPHITSRATWLTEYSFRDVLSKGLTYNQDVKIALYHDAEAAKSNLLKKADAVWTGDMFSQNYQKDQKTGESFLDVDLTDQGLAAINDSQNGFSDYYMVVYYTAKVNSDATAVLGDSGNPNDAALTWRRTSQNFSNTLEDKCVVYTFGLNLKKIFSDEKGDAAKVQFRLYNKTDDCYVTAKEAEQGVYYVTGKTAEKEEAAIFRPSSKGILTVNGIEGDIYQLTEIATDNGYSLLKDSVTIEITSTTETIIPSVAGTTGLEADTEAGRAINQRYAGGIADATGANVSESKGTQQVETANGRTIGKTGLYEGEKVSAAAKEDGIDSSMSEMTGSANARVDISILNNKSFLLPQTGGRGLYFATILGAAAVAVGLTLTRKRRKDV